MTKKPGYSKRMQENLDAWKTRFETERAEAEKAGPDLAPELRARLEADKVSGDHAYSRNDRSKVYLDWCAGSGWNDKRRRIADRISTTAGSRQDLSSYRRIQLFLYPRRP